MSDQFPGQQTLLAVTKEKVVYTAIKAFSTQNEQEFETWEGAVEQSVNNLLHKTPAELKHLLVKYPDLRTFLKTLVLDGPTDLSHMVQVLRKAYYTSTEYYKIEQALRLGGCYLSPSPEDEGQFAFHNLTVSLCSLVRSAHLALPPVPDPQFDSVQEAMRYYESLPKRLQLPDEDWLRIAADLNAKGLECSPAPPTLAHE